jgi:Domain of unknown function (DUF4342)
MQVYKDQAKDLVDQFKNLVEEGNARKVSIKRGNETVAEFPLTFGVIGAVVAPAVAIIGAGAALLTDCTINVERVAEPPAN